MVKRQTLTLITGADKGIGFETAMALGKRGQHLLVGARNQARGEQAINKLHTAGVSAELVILDVTQAGTIATVAKQIEASHGYLNVLINNAGIALDAHQPPSQLPVMTMRQDFDVNFFGLVSVTQAMIPLLKKGAPAKIINVSSNVGSLGLASDPDSRFFQVNSLGYQASKAAVNFATIDFAKELQPDHISVNSVNPGWTRTDFGGNRSGEQTVAEGAAQIVKLAADDSPDLNMTFTETAGKLPW